MKIESVDFTYALLIISSNAQTSAEHAQQSASEAR